MMKELKCLRCESDMQFWRCEKIQLGEAGFLKGDWEHVASGSLMVDIYICPECGKLEFYSAEGIPEPLDKNDPSLYFCPECGRPHGCGQMKCPYCGHKYRYCPKCGKKHDNDLAACPHCGHEYSKSNILSKFF